jgi:hypothetical protein
MNHEINQIYDMRSKEANWEIMSKVLSDPRYHKDVLKSTLTGLASLGAVASAGPMGAVAGHMYGKPARLAHQTMVQEAAKAQALQHLKGKVPTTFRKVIRAGVPMHSLMNIENRPQPRMGKILSYLKEHSKPETAAKASTGLFGIFKQPSKKKPEGKILKYLMAENAKGGRPPRSMYGAEPMHFQTPPAPIDYSMGY